MLKIAYSFFLGILLAILVGMGVQAFYAQPQSPEYPTTLNVVSKEGPNAEQQQAEKQFEQQQKAWEAKMKPYNRNVSMVALGFAVAFVAASLVLADKKFGFASDGIMLGGVFTLLYSMGRGFASQDNKYSFTITLISLLLVVALGYMRFLKDHLEHLDSTKK